MRGSVCLLSLDDAVRQDTSPATRLAWHTPLLDCAPNDLAPLADDLVVPP